MRLLSGLVWCVGEARRQLSTSLAKASHVHQSAIFADLADPNAGPEHEGPGQFFQGLRTLVTGAYYTSPEGVSELGYQGNTPIAGEYPGPSADAMAHLNAQLEKLGLAL